MTLNRWRIAAGLALVLALGALYWLLHDSGAIATLPGIVPASFLLAHFGAEMAAGEADQAMLAALGLGVLVAIPFAAKFIRDRLKRR